jgi:lysophospholipid acyltransferase (LPLAT)-like uncharacterized protein
VTRSGSEVARDGGGAADSAFRRRWTWRTRIWVVVAGWMISIVLRLLHRTLRVRLVDHGGTLPARHGGQRILAVFWHDAIPLLPIFATRLGWPGTIAVMLSWHRDAEIAAQALRHIGIRAVRGSATRGWLGAVRGLLAASSRGDDVAVVPDGPRGPRRRAKDGAAQLARATGLPLIAIGAAARPARRLGSWDRMQIPAPFARVALVMSAPLSLPTERGEALAALEDALTAVNAQAASLVGAAAE